MMYDMEVYVKPVKEVGSCMNSSHLVDSDGAIINSCGTRDIYVIRAGQQEMRLCCKCLDLLKKKTGKGVL